MQIALTAHDAKKELMVQFCIAYCGILSRHSLCGTGTTGKMIAESTGLKIQRFLSGSQGGDQQIAARISCNVRHAQHPCGHQYRHGRGPDSRAGAGRFGLAGFAALTAAPTAALEFGF